MINPAELTGFLPSQPKDLTPQYKQDVSFLKERAALPPDFQKALVVYDTLFPSDENSEIAISNLNARNLIVKNLDSWQRNKTPEDVASMASMLVRLFQEAAVYGFPSIIMPFLTAFLEKTNRPDMSASRDFTVNLYDLIPLRLYVLFQLENTIQKKLSWLQRLDERNVNEDLIARLLSTFARPSGRDFANPGELFSFGTMQEQTAALLTGDSRIKSRNRVVDNATFASVISRMDGLDWNLIQTFGTGSLEEVKSKWMKATPEEAQQLLNMFGIKKEGMKREFEEHGIELPANLRGKPTLLDKLKQGQLLPKFLQPRRTGTQPLTAVGD